VKKKKRERNKENIQFKKISEEKKKEEEMEKPASVLSVDPRLSS
jgi:hypothetical protein